VLGVLGVLDASSPATASGSSPLPEPPHAPQTSAIVAGAESGNIWGETRDITFIGLGKSSLDDVARAVARLLSLNSSL
jgi:hypothetical protein